MHPQTLVAEATLRWDRQTDHIFNRLASHNLGIDNTIRPATANARMRSLASLGRLAGALLTGLICSVSHGAHLQPDAIVMFSTAQIGSGTYNNTAELAEVYSGHNDETNLKHAHEHPVGLVLSSSGSCRTLKDLIESKFNFGVVRADAAEAIFQNPTKFGFDLRVDNLRLLGQLAPSYLHIVARKSGHTPRRLSDLSGKKMGLGLPDQLVRMSVSAVFEKHGLPLKAVEESHQPLTESIDRLRSGQLDALAIFDQLPSPQLNALLQDGQFELISLDKDLLQSTLNEFSNSAVFHVQTRQMEGVERPTTMLAIDTWLVTKATATPSEVEPLAQYLRERSSEQELSANASSPITGDISSSIPIHEAIHNSALRVEQSSLSSTDQ